MSDYLEDSILILKVKKDTDLYNGLINSKLKKSDNLYDRPYTFNKHDLQYAKDNLTIGKKYYCLVFMINNNKTDEMLLTQCIVNENTNDINKIVLHFNYIKKITSNLVINNIYSYLELKIEEDFKENSYFKIENSKDTLDYLSFLTKKVVDTSEFNYASYKKLNEEEHLSEKSSKNKECKRLYGYKKDSEINRLKLDKDRGEYQRDYERIINSKAYIKLLDKTQIFSSSKGDYYRTRMTHTAIVNQIAKGICHALNLNMYLTEAIAIGHDLGHTPFGHQGERTLDDILNYKTNIIPKIYNEQSKEKKEINYGGFKHNYQSLRIATILEETYPEYPGLNLSFQVLEGLLKHTKTNNHKWSIEEFIPESMYSQKEFFDNSCISTLEGQIVKIADEIAQRGHDLEDAFNAKLISINDLEEYLKLNKAEDLAKNIKKELNNIDEIIKSYKYNFNIARMKEKRAVSAIIHYFIEDAIKNSKGMDKITFSNAGKTLSDYLEKIITKKVINSAEVSLFDGMASNIIEGLFKAYYNSPKLLHEGTLNRIYYEFSKITDTIIDFQNGDHNLIREEFKRITTFTEKSEEVINKEKYKQKRKILVRNICDYISGMTDHFAICEYNKIYGTNY